MTLVRFAAEAGKFAAMAQSQCVIIAVADRTIMVSVPMTLLRSGEVRTRPQGPDSVLQTLQKTTTRLADVAESV